MSYLKVKITGILKYNTLCWKDHVKQINKKINSKLRLPKWLVEVSLGNTQYALNTTYNAYIKPVLRYKVNSEEST